MFIGNPRVRKVINACIDNFFYVLLYIVLPFVLGGTFIAAMYCRMRNKVRDRRRKIQNSRLKVGDRVEFQSSEITLHLLRMSGMARSNSAGDYDKIESKGIIKAVTRIKGTPVCYSIDEENGFDCNMVSSDDIIRKI